MGPGAGVHGGHVMAQGTCAEVEATQGSLTGQYLSGELRIEVPQDRHIPHAQSDARGVATRNAAGKVIDYTRGETEWLKITNAHGNNLKHVDAAFPVALLTCVTGVSGSGKSTLVNDTLYAAVAHKLHRAHEEAAPFDEILGLEQFDKVINVDQSPIGRTPRSNPGDLHRPVHADSRTDGRSAGRARTRLRAGPLLVQRQRRALRSLRRRRRRESRDALPARRLRALRRLHGQRYNRETLEVQYKGKNIAQVLDLTVEAANEFFKAVPTIARKLQTLLDVGLSYIKLGQSATTLSGGEAQRVKLALELSKRDTGRTLYILDEPTTGLHFADIAMLLKVLHQLRDAGNTIVVIEHNLDVIKTADWIIDIGPEGGAGGGRIVAAGTPEQVAGNAASYTGRYLKRLLTP